MHTITALLKQQIISVINISIPFLIVIYYYPSWVLQIEMRVLCALAMGIYIAYLNYINTKKLARQLQFIPSDHYKQQLEQWIIAAGMDPAKIQLRYGYCHEGLAMTMFDTIVIDPLVYTLFEQDPTAQQAKQVIDTYIMPARSEEVKRKILQFKNILSPQAQQFIFMHELGHIYDRYSIKKIIIIGLIGMLAAYVGISMGVYLFPLIAGYAIICALLIGGLVDIVLGYLSNLFFKLAEEKDADLFAASHCDTDTINAAADFFENHQEIVDQHKQSEGLLAQLPSSIASGHPNGNIRAGYLRELAKTIE